MSSNLPILSLLYFHEIMLWTRQVLIWCKEMMAWSLWVLECKTSFAEGVQCTAGFADGVQFVSRGYQIEDRDLFGIVL